MRTVLWITIPLLFFPRLFFHPGCNSEHSSLLLGLLFLTQLKEGLSVFYRFFRGNGCYSLHSCPAFFCFITLSPIVIHDTIPFFQCCNWQHSCPDDFIRSRCSSYIGAFLNLMVVIPDTVPIVILDTSFSFYRYINFYFGAFRKELLLFSTQFVCKCCYSQHNSLLLFMTHLCSRCCYSRHSFPIFRRL